MLDLLQNFKIENAAFLAAVSAETAAKAAIAELLAALDRALIAAEAIEGAEQTNVCVCDECGSPDLHIEVWINANTDGVQDNTGSNTVWCTECQKHGSMREVACTRAERPAKLDTLRAKCEHRAELKKLGCESCFNGYLALHVDGEVNPAFAYLDYLEPSTEVCACDCERGRAYKGDDNAYAQWVKDGRPQL